MTKEATKVSFLFDSVEANNSDNIIPTILSWLEKNPLDLKEKEIQFSLTENGITGDETFKLVPLNGKTQIISRTLKGLFYGFQELRSRKTLLEAGEIYYPLQIERALMLDFGRKFYSKEWILALIRKMSCLKLNTLQLHFSENEGFRIESETYPEIVSEEFLTKADIREIIDYANDRYIEVIPELDSPGHLKQFLNQHPEWRLERIGEPNEYIDHRALDITNPEAVAAVKKLINEYFELFKGSRYFHIGADEFVDFDSLGDYPKLQQAAKEQYGEEATGIEIYIDYTNQLIEETKAAGFIPRVWNDGFYRKNQPSLVELSKEVQITYWTRWNLNMASVVTYIEKGYEVINFNDNYFYFVLGEAAGYVYPTAEKIEQEWTPNLFAQKQLLSNKEMSSVLGSSFAVWSDRPEALTEEEVRDKLDSPLTAYANKLWINEDKTC